MAGVTSEYSIATEAQGVVGFKVVTTLGTGDKADVEGLAVEEYSVYRVAADGKEYGDGYPRCEWRFSVIKQSQFTALLAYLGTAQSATVYIRTKKTTRAYANYKAIMHRPKPDEMAPAFTSNWHDVVFRFTMLEVQ